MPLSEGLPAAIEKISTKGKNLLEAKLELSFGAEAALRFKFFSDELVEQNSESKNSFLSGEPERFREEENGGIAATSRTRIDEQSFSIRS